MVQHQQPHVCTSKLSCWFNSHDLCQHNERFRVLFHPTPTDGNQRTVKIHGYRYACTCTLVVVVFACNTVFSSLARHLLCRWQSTPCCALYMRQLQYKQMSSLYEMCLQQHPANLGAGVEALLFVQDDWMQCSGSMPPIVPAERTHQAVQLQCRLTCSRLPHMLGKMPMILLSLTSK